MGIKAWRWDRDFIRTEHIISIISDITGVISVRHKLVKSECQLTWPSFLANHLSVPYTHSLNTIKESPSGKDDTLCLFP